MAGTALIFYVNGKKIVEENPDPEAILTPYLRQNLLLTGTKIACGVGQCGACTVMLSSYNPDTKTISHRAVNSCLTPLCSLHGLAVTTVEGIGSSRTALHPVQERLMKSYGIQCGFCTPGMVMSMYALLRNHPKPTQEQIQDALKGNLCRCTGYRPILEGFSSFSGDSQCPMGKQCCKNIDKKTVETPTLYDSSTFKPYDPSQEIIFPSELQISEKIRGSQVFKHGGITWYHPASLSELISLKQDNPDAKLVAGATRVGLDWRVRPKVAGAVYINCGHVTELSGVTVTEEGVRVGAGVTIAALQQELRKICSSQTEEKTAGYRAILDILQYFGGQQVKNTGTVGGSIITGGTKSDLLPILAAARCLLSLSSADGERKITLDEKFFPTAGRTTMKPSEILSEIMIPFSQEGEHFFSFKQSPRKDMSLATLNCGAFVKLEGSLVTAITLYYGGLSHPVVRATAAEKHIGTRKLDDISMGDVKKALEDDVSAHGFPNDRLASFKAALAYSFFVKIYYSLAAGANKPRSAMMSDSSRGISSGIQVIEKVPEGQEQIDTVGRPLPHCFAEQQATGEAVFIDDMAPLKDELHLTPVLSTKAHARLVSVDPSPALAMPGVVAYLDNKDIPGEKKRVVMIERDECTFAEGEVHYDGQVIGAIVAETPQQAKAGARAVKIKYESLPHISSIQEAVRDSSYLKVAIPKLGKGDPAGALAAAEVVVEGEMEMSGQEHFYMEPQTVRVVPLRENKELEIHAAVQLQKTIQEAVSETLGIPWHKVVVKTRRSGGGFGGKEGATNLIALACAVAAQKLNRPVRCVLDRYEDMRMTGGRHPFYCKYKAGATKDGEIQAVQMDCYINGGWNTNLSPFIATNAIWAADNCYNIPNSEYNAHACKTNRSSNQAMRGAGQPQGVMAAEFVINDVAKQLGLPRYQVIEKNLYSEGDTTHYKQEMVNCTIRRCFSETKQFSNYEERVAEITQFNSENKWRKRGLDILPIKFLPLFPMRSMNQANAYVVIYLDGSVLLTHGGIEMGQGLFTKMMQVASKALGIPVEKIMTRETSTDVTPQASPTAGSSGSDLNGMAVLDACNQINKRLAPIKEANPDGTWEEWIVKAHGEAISLCASGHWRIEKDYPNNNMRSPYFCFGAGCAEVEVDCLTGEHIMRRMDIVMDVGKSLNPAIDVGQIEGGFMQGYGLYALEDIRYTPSGMMETCSPDNYKIPTVTDIPLQFNVALLKDAPNPQAVYSSKAIGEPPLLLGSAAYFAIKEAVDCFRAEAGIKGRFTLEIPATPDKVMAACSEAVTKLL